MSTVIEVENISKSYLLNHQQVNTYRSIREEVMRCLRRQNKPETETFWALKDVSFSIQAGERIGIIGRNGAGKSTLLKILSRVTKPSTGRIKLIGRLGSLLEVGTGFHPELTGRENIFLNGAILGMSRKEIRKKFNEIVEFAEIERFLDTPVKRYSSGMYVRLAFSIAAHFEPDLLILDEVLAVGDVKFQQKSKGKILNMAKEGITILFVSHSMDAVKHLCNKGIFLEKGKTQGKIDISEAINLYDDDTIPQEYQTDWHNTLSYVGQDIAQLIRVRLVSDRNQTAAPFLKYDENIWLETHINVSDPNDQMSVGFALYDNQNNLLLWSFQLDTHPNQNKVTQSGSILYQVKMPLDILNNGEYKLKTLIGIHNQRWIVEPDDKIGILRFVIDGKPSKSDYWSIKRPGIIAPRLQWVKFNNGIK